MLVQERSSDKLRGDNYRVLRLNYYQLHLNIWDCVVA